MSESDLLGVALIVRSKDGPRFVFHYPPRLISPTKASRPTYGTELDPSPPADDAGDADEDEPELPDYSLYHSLEGLGLGRKSRGSNPWDNDHHWETEEGAHMVPWDWLDAFRTQDLASILTPSRAFHKRFFELSLDPLTFVSYPMHIREDGRWKKKKRDRRSRRRRHEEAAAEAAAEAVVREAEEKKHSEGVETSDFQHTNGEVLGTPPNNEVPKQSEPSPGTTSELKVGTSFTSDDANAVDGGMTMFNLVFIMNPRRTEAPERIQDIFEHVAKDLNKALRYAQNYNNYVWKESELMLSMKEKGRENRTPFPKLWSSILAKSSLAQVMKSIYTNISRNQIAVVSLMSSPPVRLSVQIPTPYSVPLLPEPDERSRTGLYLTTAAFLTDPDDPDEPNTISRHFALLLLDDEDRTNQYIQADGGELTAPLLEYIKIVKPTISFQQTAHAQNIDLADIRVLAQHLIYHRLAIPIPPLHPRDTYVPSPNSPQDRLPEFTELWDKKFPLAPPLVDFLVTLGKAPRPYKTFIPTKMHRPLFISMLAWLVRHGWVMQLRSFAWVVAWPEIRYEVQYKLDATKLQAALEEAQRNLGELPSVETPKAAAPEPPKGPPQTPPTPMRQPHTPTNANTNLNAPSPSATASNSPNGTTQPPPSTSTPPPPSVQATPTPTPSATETTAELARLRRLRDKAAQDLADFNKRPRPERTDHPSLNRAPHLAGLAPKIIMDPAKCEWQDSLLVAAISARLDETTPNSTPVGTLPAGEEAKANGTAPLDASVASVTAEAAATNGTAPTTPLAPAADLPLATTNATAVAGLTSITSMTNLPALLHSSAKPTTQPKTLQGMPKRDERRITFGKWAKYFDGRTSLERIALLEGVKRKECWARLGEWEEFLVVVRHW